VPLRARPAQTDKQGDGQEAQINTSPQAIQGATVFASREGESMAHIYIYTARHLPLSMRELEHGEECGGGGAPNGCGAGAAAWRAESGAATYCSIECGHHIARTALAPNRRR